MSLRVAICTSSAYLSSVARKTLSRVRHVSSGSDARDAAAAVRALADGPGLAIVDVELLSDVGEGAALSKALSARREPTIVLDARGRGVSPALVRSPSIFVVRGRLSGELDLAGIEADLPLAIADARRHGRGLTNDEPMAMPPAGRSEPYQGALDLIVLGVSTGGPTLLMGLLKALDAPVVPMLIVQHMPASETAGFAKRLSEECGYPVGEVAQGPLPRSGTIGVLRGGTDFRIVRRADGGVRLREADLPDNPFHPNIDEVLLSALAADVAVGVAILTGMGQDGAAGALAMAQRGLPVIAQRPDTCAVAGMPQSVIDNRAAQSVQSPDGIARTLNQWQREAAPTEAPPRARRSS